MSRNELWKLYCDKEKQVEKSRSKRAIKTIAFFTVAIFLLIYSLTKPTGFEIIGVFLASIVFAVIYFVVNGIIFGQLSKMGENERKMLDDLKKRMDEAE